MNTIKTLALLTIMATPCTSQALELDELMATAKMAGVCGILGQMSTFQQATKMKGGDEFITRFWATEIARIGYTQEQFFSTCKDAIALYDLAIEQAEQAKE